MVTQKGDVIYGNWRDGQCQGKGKLIIPDVLEYEGEFKDHKKHGYGKEKCSNGVVYEGYFLEGKKSGEGKLVFPNGDFYQGEFKNDLFDGEGVYSWPKENRIYKGQFKEGMMEGQGKNIYSDGSFYIGHYEKGLKHGEGTYLWPTGNKFIGSWVNNMPNGIGCLVIGGKKYDVKYRLGKLIWNQKEDDTCATDKLPSPKYYRENVDHIEDIGRTDEIFCGICNAVVNNPNKCQNCKSTFCLNCIFDDNTKTFKPCINCHESKFETDLDLLQTLVKINITCPKCGELLNYDVAMIHEHER